MLTRNDTVALENEASRWIQRWAEGTSRVWVGEILGGGGSGRHGDGWVDAQTPLRSWRSRGANSQALGEKCPVFRGWNPMETCLHQEGLWGRHSPHPDRIWDQSLPGFPGQPPGAEDPLSLGFFGWAGLRAGWEIVALGNPWVGVAPAAFAGGRPAENVPGEQFVSVLTLLHLRLSNLGIILPRAAAPVGF